MFSISCWEPGLQKHVHDLVIPGYFWTYIPSRPNGISITVIWVLNIIHPVNIHSASTVLCTVFALCYVLWSIYFVQIPRVISLALEQSCEYVYALCMNHKLSIQTRQIIYIYRCIVLHITIEICLNKSDCFKIKWIFIHNVCWIYLCIFSNSLLLTVRVFMFICRVATGVRSLAFCALPMIILTFFVVLHPGKLKQHSSDQIHCLPLQFVHYIVCK